MEFTPPFLYFLTLDWNAGRSSCFHREKEMPCGIYYASCIFQSPFFVTLQQKMNAQI